MALVNDAKKEINAKIVYIGPKGAGKRTALRYLYSKLKPECRSELKSMAIGDHQLLFFDFSFPASQRTDGYSVRFHVYTLLAGEGTLPPWKMLLKGVDGVVLMADSTDGRMYGNLESCAVLMDSIAHYGMKLSSVALSLQCNKRDLKGALSLEILRSELLPETGGEPVPVTAMTGEGLLAGLNSVIREISANLGQETAAENIGESSGEELSSFKKENVEVDIEEPFDHCNEDNPEFSVEMSGTPVALDCATIMIPLRIKGAACGKSTEFKVTVSVTI